MFITWQMGSKEESKSCTVRHAVTDYFRGHIGIPILDLCKPVSMVRLNSGIDGLRFYGLRPYQYLETIGGDCCSRPNIFTLAVGMASIQCYASYMKKMRMALGAMSAGWMNEFVEIVLGSAIIIPITAGYLGIDGMSNMVKSIGGFGMGFKTMPYLFQEWGTVIAMISGVFWFGLLFIAGITSSLAMGTRSSVF